MNQLQAELGFQIKKQCAQMNDLFEEEKEEEPAIQKQPKVKFDLPQKKRPETPHKKKS